jgi:GNAT superfamily N-acetyltransferase
VQACPVDQSTLPELFDPTLPNKPALWAVLEGRHTGHALVDEPQHPTQCVLRTNACLTYFSRQTSQAFLDQAIFWFRKTDPIWLIWPAATSACLVPPEDGKLIERLEFLDYDPQAGMLENLRQHLPEGFEIRTLDRQLLERCEWKSEMEFYCGSVEHFLVHDYGLCLMRDGEIITEAYASSFGDGLAEIGAITHEAFRGQGFAAVACAFLIQTCERRGYKAYWSCDADNQASIRVARKLGFQQERAYRIYEYCSFREA